MPSLALALQQNLFARSLDSPASIGIGVYSVKFLLLLFGEYFASAVAKAFFHLCRAQYEGYTPNPHKSGQI